MNIVITNLGNHIEVAYNDLSEMVGEIKGLYLKSSIVEVTMNYIDNSVSVYTSTDRKYDLRFDMVSLPEVTSNLELYDAIKAMLV